MKGQISIFDGSERKRIRKPIRLIELFAGIGAQAKALERLGVPFERYRICEFDKYAVSSYNAVHGTDFAPSDITKIHAKDLGITDTDRYEYVGTYSFPCQDLSVAGKRRGRIGYQKSQTIMTSQNMAVYHNGRIRKLTPRECWRLMGFDDTDFDRAKAAGVSDSQLYKQAGNSIVVNVLEGIFKEMIE